MTKLFIRHYYDGLVKDDGEIDCSGDEVLTKQEFAEECDINHIMKRYENFGVLPEAREGGLFGDFSDAPDFMAAQQLVVDATNAFMSLPAKIRARFDNDPAKVLAFVADPSNREEAIRLGMIDPPPVKEGVIAVPMSEPPNATVPAAPKAP